MHFSLFVPFAVSGFSLNRALSPSKPQLQERVRDLSMAQLGDLGKALLDFETVTDFAVWLDEYQSEENGNRSSPPSS